VVKKFQNALELEWINKYTKNDIVARGELGDTPKWITYFMCATNAERG